MFAQLLLVGLLVLFATASIFTYVKINRLVLLGILAICITVTAIYSRSAAAYTVPTRVVESVFSADERAALIRDFVLDQANPLGLNAEHRSKPVSKAIARAALATKVDPNVLATFANVESTMNAKAKNGRVKGLLQFTPGTWRLMVNRHAKKHGIKRPDIYNEYHNALLGAELINDNAAWMESRLKRKTSVEEKYLASFISPHYALKMIRARGWMTAKDLVPASFAQGNKRMFYAKSGKALSVREFRRNIHNTLASKYMEITKPQDTTFTAAVCSAPTASKHEASPVHHAASGCAIDLWGDRRRSYGAI